MYFEFLKLIAAAAILLLQLQDFKHKAEKGRKFNNSESNSFIKIKVSTYKYELIQMCCYCSCSTAATAAAFFSRQEADKGSKLNSSFILSKFETQK